MKFITVKQYSKNTGVSTAYITRLLKNGNELIGINDYVKIGNTWVLYPSANYKEQTTIYKKTRKFAK